VSKRLEAVSSVVACVLKQHEKKVQGGWSLIYNPSMSGHRGKFKTGRKEWAPPTSPTSALREKKYVRGKSLLGAGSILGSAGAASADSEETRPSGRESTTFLVRAWKKHAPHHSSIRNDCRNERKRKSRHGRITPCLGKTLVNKIVSVLQD